MDGQDHLCMSPTIIDIQLDDTVRLKSYQTLQNQGAKYKRKEKKKTLQCSWNPEKTLATNS